MDEAPMNVPEREQRSEDGWFQEFWHLAGRNTPRCQSSKHQDSTRLDPTMYSHCFHFT